MLKLYGKDFTTHLLLGTAQYPSLDILQQALQKAEIQIATVSLRRELSCGEQSGKFWQNIQKLNLSLLPNTAGCYSAKEAITTAHLARELFKTDWLKLEIIANEDTLLPNVLELVRATEILVKEGFQIFAYSSDDLYVAQKLYDLGCEVIMPYCAPIGSARGIKNSYNLRSIRAYLPEATLIIDAGIGAPSHAAKAMELGYDAVLLNTAVAKAHCPVQMAQAFALAVKAGYMGYKAGIVPPRDMASPSTPLFGKACFD